MDIYKPENKSLADILTSEEATLIYHLEYSELWEKLEKEPIGINLPYTKLFKKFYYNKHIYFIDSKDKKLLKDKSKNTIYREFDKVNHRNRYVFTGDPKEILDSFLKKGYTISNKF